MKLRFGTDAPADRVALRVRARIETVRVIEHRFYDKVALRVRARIETKSRS